VEVDPLTTSRSKARFSVANWLTQSQHSFLSEREPGPGPVSELLQRSELLRAEAIRNSVQLLVVERCGLAASAGLINAAESQQTKIYLATQVLDTARHVEALSDRLASLGVGADQLSDAISAYANPDLLGLAETALDPITNGDFIVGLIGQNVVLTEITLAAYELLEVLNSKIDPHFSRILASMIADDRRHLEFGIQTLAHLVKRHPEKKSAIVELATSLSRHMIHAFADLFRDNPTADELKRLRSECAISLELNWEGVDLVDAVPGEVERTIISLIAGRLKQQLGQLGMGYRKPAPLEMR
jgi:hypothetical protein